MAPRFWTVTIGYRTVTVRPAPRGGREDRGSRRIAAELREHRVGVHAYLRYAACASR